MRRKVLLLQGPVGPFFRNFARELEGNGFQVYKINFNGGDRFFYHGKNTVNYQGSYREWETWLERYVLEHDIGRIYLFGDSRQYHRTAKQVAERNSIRVFAFEEGYIRPNFVTLEENGVNGNSSLINKSIDLSHMEPDEEHPGKYPTHVFRNAVIFAMTYYLASAALSWQFRQYVHHRPLNPLSEGSKWLLSLFRKFRFRISQRKLAGQFTGALADRFFLVPLQVHCDMQITAHSDYTSVEHFIGEVVASFAKNASKEHSLVFKHHPMDRGYTNYTTLIKTLAREYSLEGRLYYVHDLELPAMLKAARGTVVINSTVGMSSLFHHTPVKTMGQAIYDREGLTFQNELDEFWRSPGEASQSAYTVFRDYLIHRNQINGSFYKRLSGVSSHSGLEWSREMLLDHSYMPGRVDSPNPPSLQVVAGRDVSGLPDTGEFDAGRLATR